MGYIRDAWSVIRGRPVVPAEAVADSVVDLLAALEKRAATFTDERSIAGRADTNLLAVNTLLERSIQSTVATESDIASLQTIVNLLLRDVPIGTIANILANVPSTALSDLLSRISGAIAKDSDMQTVLGRLTNARADLLDNLKGLSHPQLRSQLITATTVWVKPANVDSVLVTLVGGGGSGARTTSSLWRARGGLAGEYVWRVPRRVTGHVTVYIGIGGAGKTSDGSGNNGGASSFDALTVRGGLGGSIVPLSEGNHRDETDVPYTVPTVSAYYGSPASTFVPAGFTPHGGATPGQGSIFGRGGGQVYQFIVDGPATPVFFAPNAYGAGSGGASLRSDSSGFPGFPPGSFAGKDGACLLEWIE